MGDSVRRIDWSRRETWPYGGAHHAFVGEALEIVGKHCLQDDWTGREFWHLGHREVLSVSGSFQEATANEKQAAKALLSTYEKPKSDWEGELDQTAWDTALSVFERYRQDRRQSFDRIQNAKRKVRTLCSEGVLVASVRWEHDGEHSDIKPERWNLERYNDWLSYGDGQLSDFGFQSSDRAHLFVARDGLERLAVPNEPQLPAGFDFPKSDYLNAFLSILPLLPIDLEDPPANIALGNMIRRKAAELGYQIPSGTADRMATIMRGSRWEGGLNSPGHKERSARKRDK